VALSRQQRRALREIEEHLAAEDPALATLLRRAEGTGHERVIRGVTGGSVTAAVTVLFLGLVLIDAGVLSGWLLILVVLLCALCLSASWLVWVMSARDR
jgi:Flp pilus assembly protein TadB